MDTAQLIYRNLQKLMVLSYDLFVSFEGRLGMEEEVSLSYLLGQKVTFQGTMAMVNFRGGGGGGGGGIMILYQVFGSFHLT